MAIPSVVSTPGRTEGSQFNFDEIFVQRLEQEVCYVQTLLKYSAIFLNLD